MRRRHFIRTPPHCDHAVHPIMCTNSPRMCGCLRYRNFLKYILSPDLRNCSLNDFRRPQGVKGVFQSPNVCTGHREVAAFACLSPFISTGGLKVSGAHPLAYTPISHTRGPCKRVQLSVLCDRHRRQAKGMCTRPRASERKIYDRIARFSTQ